MGERGRPLESAPRSLFILSNDFGELVMALWFMRRQALERGATMMLPHQLAALNADLLDVPVRRYSSAAEILEVVKDEKPSLVCLFSGYLLSNNGLIDRRDLAALIGRLRAEGVTVTTSDFSLGLAAVVTPADYDETLIAAGSGIWRLIARLQVRRICRDLSKTAAVLRHAVHIYPMPIDALHGGDVRRQSFHNPTFETFRDGDDLPPASGNDDSWLFVLASHDVWCQHRLVGETALAEILAARLLDTVAAGRRPVLIAPEAVLKQVRPQVPAQGVELVPFCAYPEFVARLRAAEYAFYWNVFSCSVLHRLANARPTFFFDRGHVARAFTRSYPLALRCIYNGHEPRYLDAAAPLDRLDLERRAAQAHPSFVDIRRHLQRSPTPDQVIAQLCA